MTQTIVGRAGPRLTARVSNERPTLLQLLELERARRDGKLADEQFEAELARLKARSKISAIPWKTVLLLALAALVIAGMALSLD